VAASAVRVFGLVLHVLLDGVLVVVEHDLLVDQFLVVLLLQAVDLEVEVKGTHWFSCRFIIWKM